MSADTDMVDVFGDGFVATEVGLLGAKVDCTGGVEFRDIVIARLDEIERRIIEIDAALSRARATVGNTNE